MRIAVLIIGLLLGLVLFFQSVVVYGLSNATDAPETGAVAWGVMVALLWLVGCAFVLPMPRVSVGAFALAGVIAVLVASGSDYTDMGIWGVLSFLLAALSWFGWRSKRRDDEERLVERERQQQRDKLLEDMLRRGS